MYKLLDTPLLPTHKVKLVAVGEEYVDVINSLEKLGIECFKIKRSENLVSPISCHADCRFIQLNKKTFVVDETIVKDFNNCLIEYFGKSYNLVNYLTSRAVPDNYISVITEEIKSPYPDDIKLNAKVINKYILCNSKYISKHIDSFAHLNSYNILHTNQGYSACSTLLLNDKTIITDDLSIYDACNRIEISSTILDKGQIKLNGFDYGFIGGCCGFIDKNLLAFTGRIDSLTDSDILYNVLKNNNIDYIELTDNELFDVGGIIPIIESCV